MLMAGEHPQKGPLGTQRGNGFCHRIQGPGCHFEGISSPQSQWWVQMERKRLFLACQQRGSLHYAFVAALVPPKDRSLNVVPVGCSVRYALRMLLVRQRNSRMHRFGCNFRAPLNTSFTAPACNHGSAKLLCAQSVGLTLGHC